MLRSMLLIGLFVTSCKGAGSTPAPVGAGSASQPAAGGSAFATPLRGPYATLDAYCATRPRGDDHTCDRAEVAATGALPDGLLESATVYENNDEPNHDIGCAVALRTSAGWFVGPPSAETCSQPSYIDLQDVDIDTDDAIAAITFGVNWHTKNGDEEAPYKLTALCGTGRGGVPACTPVFLSQCEERAPVSGCNEASFALTWSLDGDTVTFTHDRKIDNDAVPSGTRTIFGGR